jgi:hypothetical protein
VRVLAKPHRDDELAQTIREILDAVQVVKEPAP